MQDNLAKIRLEINYTLLGIVYFNNNDVITKRHVQIVESLGKALNRFHIACMDVKCEWLVMVTRAASADWQPVVSRTGVATIISHYN